MQINIYHIGLSTDQGHQTVGVWTYSKTQALELVAQRMKSDGYTNWEFKSAKAVALGKSHQMGTTIVY